MDIIEKEEADGIMVFVETKRNADFLASFLSEKQVLTTSIHGDRYQRQREEALKDFKSGKMKLLIATSVAARGLDIKNVRHVINFDLPSSIDEYVHRIGRTGRVGNCGKATSFFDVEEDFAIAADLKKILHQAGQKVPEFLMDVDVSSSKNHGNNKKGNFGGKDVRKGQYHRKSDRPTPGTGVRPDEPVEKW
jgi:probable ATP-dependent RNA helicase DDX4